MKLPVDILARRLNLPVSTAIRWIRQGKIPVRMSGRECRFTEKHLREWALQRKLDYRTTQTTDDDPPTSRKDALITVIKRGGPPTLIGSDTIHEVLAAAVAHIPGLNDTQKTTLHAKLVEREALGSTGMGDGIAVPHLRAPLPELIAKEMIRVCYLAEPINYNAIDDQPVSVLFLLLSTSIQSHLHWLSRLAFCIRDTRFRTFLKSHPEPDTLWEKIALMEAQFESPHRK